MNIVRTGVRSVWKRSWTFLGVKLQHSGSQRDIVNHNCRCQVLVLPKGGEENFILVVKRREENLILGVKRGEENVILVVNLRRESGVSWSVDLS